MNLSLAVCEPRVASVYVLLKETVYVLQIYGLDLAGIATGGWNRVIKQAINRYPEFEAFLV